MVTEVLYHGIARKFYVSSRQEDGSIAQDEWDDVTKIVLVGYTLVLYHSSSAIPTVYAAGIWTIAS